MNYKLAFTAILSIITIQCYAQDYSSNTESIRVLDDKIEDGEFNVDKNISTATLTLTSSHSSTNKRSNEEDHIISDKEWKKIMKKMKRSRKKVKNNEEYVQLYKTIDTVYVSSKRPSEQIQLSGW
ncbi:hypothetical protein [Aquimarina brevivitae]|uniref:Uncharacterized protein n=1 Tax=Aquimarina brevivitae TaxID=323412 RepID=A0A4Q7NZ30_9FLAO|nr:hypothetical protein [Aquimarina brevivitae]RZS92248.1 hypothetical protein EV197_2884 [Aquimarina brevivitae]